MPGARATRSSLRIEQPDLPSTEARAATAAQAEVLPNAAAAAVSRAQPGRGQKRQATEINSSHVESTKNPVQVVDDKTLPGVEPRSGGSAKINRKAAGKASKAQLQASSNPAEVQTGSQLESDNVSHVQHDTSLASTCRPRQQQQANERQKSCDKANAQASKKQIPAAGTSQPHADSTVHKMPPDNRADQQQVKRRKAASASAQATQAAKQLTTAASGSTEVHDNATDSAADSQQEGLPNKRARWTSRAQKSRTQPLGAGAQATMAKSSLNAGAEVPSDAQAAPQGTGAPEVVTAKPGSAKQSKSAASKRKKNLPGRVAAPKRSRTVAAAAEPEQQAPASSSKCSKSKKNPKGTTARQAAKGASVPTAGPKQPARRTRATKAAGQTLGQQQQVQAGQDSSKLPASRSAAPSSTIASETHALASKVMQQTMGLSARPASASKLSDGLKTAGTSGETSAKGLSTSVQKASAKSSSLFGLASVLASKSKEEGSGARTSMLPFLPRPQPPAAQPVSASRQQHSHRAASATASAAASVDSDRQEPAADSSQQAGDAVASKLALPTAALPCYEPGFLTQAFSVSAFGARRNHALGELQQLLCAAEESQTDLPDVEAASLRITPLEEQLQAAATELPVLQREMQELKQTQGRRRRPPRNPVVAHPGSGQTAQALPGQQAGTQQQPQQHLPSHQVASQQADAQQVQQPAAQQGQQQTNVRQALQSEARQAQQSATPQGQQCATTRAQQSKAQPAQQPVAQQGLQSAITRAQLSKAQQAQQSEAQQRQQAEVQQPAAQQGQQSATQHAQRSKAQQAQQAAAQQSGPLQRQQQSDAQQAQQPAAQQCQQGAKQRAQQSRAQQAQQPAAQQAQQSEAKEAQQSAAQQRQAAPLLSHQQAASSATAHLGPAALPQPVSTAEPCNGAEVSAKRAAEAGNAAGDRATEGDQSGTRAECRLRADTRANTASTALTSKQAISAKALAATDEDVKSIKAKWQQGLDEAAKVLSCLQFLQQTGAKAARQRWNRNTSSELQAPQAALGGQASTASQTCDAAAQSTAAGQASAVRTASNRAQLASEGSDDAEGRGGGGLAGDTVLVFAIHRFDSAGVRSGQSLVEIAVLASQPLTALRDVIECEADVNLASQHQCRPAGFFYIEGTFYNDMRHANAEDYSFATRRFCSQRGITVPCSAPTDPPAYPPSSLQPRHHSNNSCQPQALHMEKTCFGDLCLRIGQGAGYVYMHQGCCEHLLELKDVRTVQAADPKLASAFPVVLFQERKVRRLCNLCKSTASVWVTYDDKYAPENPCFWCEDCYHQMHYDASNTLLYSDYIALPYQWEMGMVKSIYNDNEKKTEEAV